MAISRCCPPAPIAPAEQIVMVGTHDFAGSPSGLWMPVGPDMSLDLPSAGTYHLFADVRSSITSNGTGTGNPHIVARLFNLTAAAAVPDTARLVTQVVFRAGQPDDQQVTAPINKILTVTGPTTVSLQGARVLGGAATDAGLVQQSIISVAGGRTTFGYVKVSG